MGLLAPLYALAALAVIGPVVFHLIRRQPQGQLPFSSLMFLKPSPPRLTRRSRLDNILLLCLRALAILLIAIAFARPYFRQESLLSTNLPGRTIVLAIDTSGSMQRDGVWSEAVERASEIVSGLAQNDRVALYSVDSKAAAVVALEEVEAGEPQISQEAVADAIEQLEPTWKASELSKGLISIAETISNYAIAQPGGEFSLVLISDLQTGASLDGLQGYPWPDSIRLDVDLVRPLSPGNARASLMASEPSDASDRVKLRVENDPDSESDLLSLAWVDRSGRETQLESGRLQVPAGQVRVVTLPAPPQDSVAVRLAGDAWDADNTVYLPANESIEKFILFVGEQQVDRADSLGFFLERAPLSSRRVQQTVQQVAADALSVRLQDPAVHAVVVEPLPQVLTIAKELRLFAERGGVVLVCLARQAAEPEGLASFLQTLFSVETATVVESETSASDDDFALLSDLNYRHPLLAPFADPRFNDFSKIRVWSYRNVTWQNSGKDHTAEPEVLIKYDSGGPMLAYEEVNNGELNHGKLWLLTTGWQPTASGLGLSSKFVPLLAGMLAPQSLGDNATSIAVGEPVEVSDSGSLEITDPNGNGVAERWESTSQTSIVFEAPGQYLIETAAGRSVQNVQVPLAESRLEPLDPGLFEQFGIPLGQLQQQAEREASARQLKVEELEKRQRLWQWLLTGCLIVLAVETFLSGQLARRSTRPLMA